MNKVTNAFQQNDDNTKPNLRHWYGLPIEVDGIIYVNMFY